MYLRKNCISKALYIHNDNCRRGGTLESVNASDVAARDIDRGIGME